MEIALALLSNILIPAAVFSLIAAGFSLIYAVTRVLHLAHGAVAIAAGYAFYAGTARFGWGPAVSVLFAVAVAVGLGLLSNALVYERMRERGIVSTAGTLIATISLLLIIENVLLAVFGSATRTFYAFTGKTVSLGGVILTWHEIRILVVSTILLLAFVAFLRRSKTGKALRAVHENESQAEVVGISSRRMRALAFGIGSFLAGVAGVLFAIEYNLAPSMSTSVAVRMFFRAVVGGIGSIGGAVTGSALLSTTSALTGWYWSVGWVDLVDFLTMFLVLLIRPQGLFGRKKRSI